MKRFRLIRIEDPTGVSGTGLVAEGVVFTGGKCALHWLTAHQSVAVYDSLQALQEIHLHHGMTRLEWIDTVMDTHVRSGEMA